MQLLTGFSQDTQLTHVSQHVAAREFHVKARALDHSKLQDCHPHKKYPPISPLHLLHCLTTQKDQLNWEPTPRSRSRLKNMTALSGPAARCNTVRNDDANENWEEPKFTHDLLSAQV